MKTDLEQCILKSDLPVNAAMEHLDRTGLGVVLVVDEDGRLLKLFTDGDFRRLILGGHDLKQPLGNLLSNHTPSPLTAGPDKSDTELLHLMNTNTVRHIPIVDENGVVQDIALLKNLVKEYEPAVQAVVMAGGFGKRLHPLTEDLPKPMLKVGDRPVLEHIIRQLGQAGIRRVNITTHYKPEKITEHFGDGTGFDVDLEYVTEEQPLGTAGSLGLIKQPDQPVLVMNGDIVTKVDFQSMYHFHSDHHAEMTVAVRQYDMDIPYGVVETEDIEVRGIKEKPVMKFFVNAGIYLLQPSVFDYIKTDGERFDMTDLIEVLLKQKKKIVSFPISEYWLDIGHHDDFEQAQKDLAEQE